MAPTMVGQDTRLSSGRAARHQAVLDGVEGRLGAILHPELVEDGTDVALDRALGEEESCGDALVALPFGEEGEDLAFPLREPFERSLLGSRLHALEELALGLGMERGLAAPDTEDGAHEV